MKTRSDRVNSIVSVVWHYVTDDENSESENREILARGLGKMDISALRVLDDALTRLSSDLVSEGE